MASRDGTEGAQTSPVTRSGCPDTRPARHQRLLSAWPSAVWVKRRGAPARGRHRTNGGEKMCRRGFDPGDGQKACEAIAAGEGVSVGQPSSRGQLPGGSSRTGFRGFLQRILGEVRAVQKNRATPSSASLSSSSRGAPSRARRAMPMDRSITWRARRAQSKSAGSSPSITAARRRCSMI